MRQEAVLSGPLVGEVQDAGFLTPGLWWFPSPSGLFVKGPDADASRQARGRVLPLRGAGLVLDGG